MWRSSVSLIQRNPQMSWSQTQTMRTRRQMNDLIMNMIIWWIGKIIKLLDSPYKINKIENEHQPGQERSLGLPIVQPEQQDAPTPALNAPISLLHRIRYHLRNLLTQACSLPREEEGRSGEEVQERRNIQALWNCLRKSPHQNTKRWYRPG